RTLAVYSVRARPDKPNCDSRARTGDFSGKQGGARAGPVRKQDRPDHRGGERDRTRKRGPARQGGRRHPGRRSLVGGLGHARGGGAIVNVASMAALRPNGNHSPYGMTKAGVVSLTQHAAIDYAADGIRVNCLCPGPVETPIFDQMRDALDPAAYAATRRRLERK